MSPEWLLTGVAMGTAAWLAWLHMLLGCGVEMFLMCLGSAW